MASITDIRQGIATNLGTITGLRTASVIPEDPKPPIGIVTFERVEYDTAMARALDTYTFRVILVVGRVDSRGAQINLDGYLSGSGSTSEENAKRRDALRAVVELHKPEGVCSDPDCEPQHDWCSCEMDAYPCPTIQQIIENLK